MNNEWSEEIIKSVQLHANKLKSLININYNFHTIIMEDKTIYTNSDWPSLDIIENKLVNRTFQRFYEIFGIIINKKDINTHNIYESFVEMILHLMNCSWSKYIQESELDTSGYLDYVMRSSLIYPPGIGFSFLCLKIAATVELNPVMIEEIEISRLLNPKLPFSLDDEKSLLLVVTKEDRLRLAMCLANEVGRAASKLKINVNTQYFNMSIWNLLIAIKEHNNTNVSIDLLLLSECLKYSRKHRN